MRTLRLAKNLALPLEAVTETFAFLAKRGAGKSYAACVMVERMLAKHLHVVVLDPMGIWFGLRTAADGKGDGYQIPILGGDHGDIPLEPHAGAYVADLVVNDKISMVIDVSDFSKTKRKQFVADFAERLYRKNREPLHLVLEEADMFAPQKPREGEHRMLGAIEDIVRRGRSRGIGVSLISQRSAVLNKDVLTQTECMIALRTTGPQDRKAIGDWIDVQGDRDAKKEVLDSLPGLPIGTAWFWSPGWLEQLVKVDINQKITLDTGATPKVGGKRRALKTVADVDLTVLAERMISTIAKAEAENPARLRGTIRDLKKQVAKLETRPEGTVGLSDIEVGKRIDQSVATTNQAWQNVVTERDQIVTRYLDEISERDSLIGSLLEKLKSQAIAFSTRAAEIVSEYDSGIKVQQYLETSLTKTKERPGSNPPPTFPKPKPPANPPPATSAAPAPSVKQVDSVEVYSLRPGAQRLAKTLVAHFPDELTKMQLGFLADVSPRGGTFTTYLSNLRMLGLIDQTGNGIKASQKAMTLFGGSAKRLTRDELFVLYRNKLRPGARRMLDVVNEMDGIPIDRQELGQRANVSTAGGTFTTYLSNLRTVGLIEESSGGIALSETLINA